MTRRRVLVAASFVAAAAVGAVVTVCSIGWAVDVVDRAESEMGE